MRKKEKRKKSPVKEKVYLFTTLEEEEEGKEI